MCEYVSFHGKSSFVDVIKLRILRWEISLCFPRRPKVLTRILLTEVVGGGREDRRVRVREKCEDAALLALKMEEIPQAKNIGSLSNLEKAKKWIPLRASRRNTAQPIP